MMTNRSKKIFGILISLMLIISSIGVNPAFAEGEPGAGDGPKITIRIGNKESKAKLEASIVVKKEQEHSSGYAVESEKNFPAGEDDIIYSVPKDRECLINIRCTELDSGYKLDCVKVNGIKIRDNTTIRNIWVHKTNTIEKSIEIESKDKWVESDIDVEFVFLPIDSKPDVERMSTVIHVNDPRADAELESVCRVKTDGELKEVSRDTQREGEYPDIYIPVNRDAELEVKLLSYNQKKFKLAKIEIRDTAQELEEGEKFIAWWGHNEVELEVKDIDLESGKLVLKMKENSVKLPIDETDLNDVIIEYVFERRGGQTEDVNKVSIIAPGEDVKLKYSISCSGCEGNKIHQCSYYGSGKQGDLEFYIPDDMLREGSITVDGTPGTGEFDYDMENYKFLGYKVNGETILQSEVPDDKDSIAKEVGGFYFSLSWVGPKLSFSQKKVEKSDLTIEFLFEKKDPNQIDPEADKKLFELKSLSVYGDHWYNSMDKHTVIEHICFDRPWTEGNRVKNAFEGQSGGIDINLMTNRTIYDDAFDFKVELYEGKKVKEDKLIMRMEGKTVHTRKGQHFIPIYLDKMKKFSYLTAVVTIGENEEILTYDVTGSVKDNEEYELSFLQKNIKADCKGRTYGPGDNGPDIFDMAAITDAKGSTEIYAASHIGVLKYKGEKFNLMDGLYFPWHDLLSMSGAAVAVGGTDRENLYAVCKYENGYGVAKLNTKDERWERIDSSYKEHKEEYYKIIKRKSLVIDENHIYTYFGGMKRWDGEKWTEAELPFISFAKFNNEVYYGNTSEGPYRYNKETKQWEKLEDVEGEITAVNSKGAMIIGMNECIMPDGSKVDIPQADDILGDRNDGKKVAGIGINENNDIFITLWTWIHKGGYRGRYVYRLKDGEWILLNVDSFGTENDKKNGISSDIARERAYSVDDIYNFSDKISIFAGEYGTLFGEFADVTLKFDSGNETEPDKFVGKPFTPVNMPSEPSRSGYTFAGWYTREALQGGGNSFDMSKMPIKDMTLFAKWIKKDAGIADPFVSERSKANKSLDEALNNLQRSDYADEEWKKVQEAYESGKLAIAKAETYKGIYDALNAAIARMQSVKPSKAGEAIVCFSMELFTLNKGYIIEPTLVTVNKYELVSKTITDLLKKEFPGISQPWKMTGTIESEFYLSHAYSKQEGFVGEFDHGTQSGWMYSVNGRFPGVGAASWALTGGETVRWQYTCTGLGADLGADNSEWSSAPAAPVAYKDALTWRIAEINQNKEEYFKHADGNEKAYKKAISVLKNMRSSQAEVDAALTALGTFVPNAGAGGDVNTGNGISITNTQVVVTGGAAVVTVKDENFIEVIKQAKENKSSEIILDAKVKEAKVDKVTVELSKKIAEDILKETKADLTIALPETELKLSRDALKEIASQAKVDKIAVEVEKVKTLKDEQKKLIGESGEAFTLIIKSGDTSIHSFGNGTVTVRKLIPYMLTDKKVVAVYVTDKNELEVLKGKKIVIDKQNFYEFTTNHFSYFALVDADEAGIEVEEMMSVDEVKNLVKTLKLKVKTKALKKSVRVIVKADKTSLNNLRDNGYTVKYKFYRANKKKGKFKVVSTKDVNKYTNVKITKGKTYYYKAKIFVYDSLGNLVTKTSFKQSNTAKAKIKAGKKAA